jgi:DNA-binding MarR family transcriptional regulator
MTSDRLRLDHFLPYRLSVASNAASELIAGAYRRRFGISIPEWRIVAILGEGDSLAPGALCARARMDKVTVSRAAKTLENRGLITRTPHDGDQRSHRLALTDEGRSLYATVGPEALALEERIFGAFAGWEREALGSFLDRILAAADACAE